MQVWKQIAFKTNILLHLGQDQVLLGQDRITFGLESNQTGAQGRMAFVLGAELHLGRGPNSTSAWTQLALG